MGNRLKPRETTGTILFQEPTRETLLAKVRSAEKLGVSNLVFYAQSTSAVISGRKRKKEKKKLRNDLEK